ncbi:PilW family protein [Propionivibrio limicola]|uniref:PilW family protein n=1 Tax=Propionivibrio limicola TaxID=167645 RepID=UPI001291D775|nr:PilW family protein [Propionivibrio limicola]
MNAHPLLPNSPERPSSTPRQSGTTLIELMVGMTLGLIITGSLGLIFLNNSRARQEIEKTSQQIENGRYATQLLLDDLRLAGYYGEFSPANVATPSDLPDPSQTDVNELAEAIVLPVQGYNNGASMPSALTALLADRRSNTDVLVIRRTSTCVAGAAGCGAVDTTRNTYFQTTLCNNQLNVLPATSQFLIGTTASQFTTTNPAVTGSANPPAFLARKDCLTAAALRAYYTRIYFISNNNQSGDGIPTLKMAELGAGSFSLTPLVEGIEQIQFDYGVDTNGDGTPESYTASPADTAAWRQVTAVKIHLLARNTRPSAGFVDSRTYTLGAGNDFGPYNDAYKRHAYTTLVRLNNVAGRLE